MGLTIVKLSAFCRFILPYV